MRFELTILGTASALPAFGRLPTSQLVNHNDRLYLLDCGEGTQLQLLRYNQPISRLDAIFISHLHGDHVFGLFGLLTTYSMLDRQRELAIFGPPGIRQLIEGTFRVTGARLRYPLTITELTPEDHTGKEAIYERKALAVSAIGLQHRIDCLGYIFQEKPKARRFLPQAAEALNIPKPYYRLLQQGNAVELADGTVVSPNQVLGEAPASYSYAFCTDTRPFDELPHYLQGVDVLYQEATFLQEHTARAAETYHCTATQAASIAQAAGVKSLLLGHYSARYPSVQPIQDEARHVFAQAYAVQEGMQWRIDALAQGLGMDSLLQQFS